MDNTDSIVDTPVGTPLRPAVERCLDLFSSAMKATRAAGCTIPSSKDRTDLYHDHVTDERDRFSAWASNVSARTDGYASLDYRLRQMPEELEIVRDLIDIICEQLQEYTSAINKAAETSGFEGMEWDTYRATRSTSSNIAYVEGTPDIANADLPELERFNYAKTMESINISNGWLHRTSNLLRVASIANRSIRDQSSKLPGVNVVGLTALFTGVVDCDFPGLSGRLKSRMCRTMVERYRRILCLQKRHGLEWKQQIERQENLERPSEQPTETELPYKHDRTTPDTSKEETLKACTIQETPTLLSKRSATEPDQSRYSAPSAVSNARSTTLSHIVEELLPTPPIACQTEPHFTCEICCMIRPSKIGRDAVLWSEHVKRDLDVYVCLSNKCNDPYNLYSSAGEWLSHMKYNHLVSWTCPEEGHERLEFKSPQKLEKHINESHPDMCEPSVVPYIMDACRTYAELVFDVYPFCQQPAGNNFQVHIGHHLEYLALMSLPWAYSVHIHSGNESEPLPSEDGESVGQSTGSLESGSLHLDNDIGPVPSEHFEETLTLEGQEASAGPEGAESSIHGDCQAEWGFVPEITMRHEQSCGLLHRQTPETSISGSEFGPETWGV